MGDNDSIGEIVRHYSDQHESARLDSGWFRLERTHVNSAANGSGNGDWKTQRLEVHMIGRAMLFKTIARETSEVRGGFSPVPSGLSLLQAAILVNQPISMPVAQPVALATSR